MESLIRQKMVAAGLSGSAISAFLASYRQLRSDSSGLIPEAGICPVENLPVSGELPVPGDMAKLLGATVVLKLNGGLGTGMGLERAKSLLPIRDGLTFLDLIARQILHLRRQSPVRFLVMNSFSTSADTLAYLAGYPELGDEIELMQGKVPKLTVDTLEPITWPANPAMEWCPPGHGDLYPSLDGSGLLDRLIDEGVQTLFVSNSDNLGATLDPAILAWFAESGLSFLMEVTRRTEADRKGGHLAVDGVTGRLLLRESAQCPEDDLGAFQDVDRHRYFNTNNLWLRLVDLRDAMRANGGVLPLPMIRNSKTVDPRDPGSPAVWQLETAMGAAIAAFGKTGAIDVPRSRFAPVKTTADLLTLRSDACVITDDHRLVLAESRQGRPPFVDLDGKHYKFVDQLDDATAAGVPSLVACDRLQVRGPVHFAGGVRLAGDVRLINGTGTTQVLGPGLYENTTIQW